MSGSFLLLAYLADQDRTMPETRPDSETLEHRALCTCKVCKRPAAKELWRKKMKRKPR